MTYPTIDLAYKAQKSGLVAYAAKHLIIKEHKLDCVQDAFVKVLKYINAHPNAKISGFLLKIETLRAIKRYNKQYQMQENFNEKYTK